jgi:hypothetical protein
MVRPGPLLRLVHSLERRRAGRTFTLAVTVRRPGLKPETDVVIGSARVESHGPRAVVVGTGERVDVAVGGGASPLPGGMSSQAGDGIMPRHLALLVVPLPNGTLLRAISLHPERGFAVLPVEARVPDVAALEHIETTLGSVVAWNALRLTFDGYILDVHVDGAGAADVLDVLPVGQQLGFYAGSTLRTVGTAIASIAGPGGGGHAIPALVLPEPVPVGEGSLVLRARSGVFRVDASAEDLFRGVLIGRSRRCVLGRGFDENDGLSRVHALVVGLEEAGTSGVFAFDLASRYGLRDVSRPSRLVPMARLDDGVGCLVYGAGYLTWEFR